MIHILESDDEGSFLKRKKRSVAKKFSPTQSKAIEEANALAIYLLAASRIDESVKLLESYAPSLKLDRHRPQRWEASCLAKALLAYQYKKFGKIEESITLCNQITLVDYPLSFRLEHSRMWEYIKGWAGDLEIIEMCNVKNNDRCLIYAERMLVLIFYLTVMPHSAGLSESDTLVLNSYIANVIERLKIDAFSNEP